MIRAVVGTIEKLRGGFRHIFSELLHRHPKEGWERNVQNPREWQHHVERDFQLTRDEHPEDFGVLEAQPLGEIGEAHSAAERGDALNQIFCDAQSPSTSV
jgi:hypothetical protein